jgi:hypothetical protein
VGPTPGRPARLRDEKVSLVLKRLASRAGLTDPDRYAKSAAIWADPPAARLGL